MSNAEQILSNYLNMIGVDPSGCAIRSDVACPSCGKITATATVVIEENDHQPISGCVQYIAAELMDAPSCSADAQECAETEDEDEPANCATCALAISAEQILNAEVVVCRIDCEMYHDECWNADHVYNCPACMNDASEPDPDRDRD